MGPQIRFCTSADGTRIAYSTYGEPAARALVLVTRPDDAQEFWWKYPGMRALLEGFASGRRLVAFDRRGVGSSERDVDDLAVPAQLADLAAVVDELGLERVALMGIALGGALAAAYAVEHPERVGRLLLWHPLIPTSASQFPGIQAIAQSFRANWSFARRSLAAIAYPNGPTDLQRWFSNMLRDSVAPEVAARHFEVIAEFDGSAILRNVQAPTLVLANSGTHGLEIASVRAVASLIPDARLVTLEGDWGTPTVDPSQLLAAVRNFLDEADAESEAVESQPATGLVSILFTDVEGSTSLTQRLGDAKARDILRTHERIVRDALRSHQGSEVKTMGDGFMASFSSATKALECAIAIERAFSEHNESAQEPIRVRVGLNAGEPIAEEEDLFGTAVIRAARITGIAQGGEILVANVVRELAEGKGFMFSDRGPVALRGFDDPVKVFEVRWQE